MFLNSLPFAVGFKFSSNLCEAYASQYAMGEKLHTYSKKYFLNHNFYTDWTAAIKLYDFVNISFHQVLLWNQVFWWKNSFENLPQSQHSEGFTVWKSGMNFHSRFTQWKFHYVKVMVDFSPTVYVV